MNVKRGVILFIWYVLQIVNWEFNTDFPKYQKYLRHAKKVKVAHVHERQTGGAL